MEKMFMPINDLVFAPINAIKEADISLSGGILAQIATVSDPTPQKDGDDDTLVMKLKNIKFIYEKLKPDETGDKLETIGLTVPTASIIQSRSQKRETSSGPDRMISFCSCLALYAK